MLNSFNADSFERMRRWTLLPNAFFETCIGNKLLAGVNFYGFHVDNAVCASGDALQIKE